MSYPAFYQAWHPTTDAQNFTFENFPQILAEAINNEADLCKKVKLICIDGSKFIDRNNPASKIYTQLVKAGCSKCDDGTPKTMAYLQTYWELLSSDKQVILVFYESAAEPTQTRFSDRFLKDLSKFDGAIVADPPQPPLARGENLQWFSASQRLLVEYIVGWIRETVGKNL